MRVLVDTNVLVSAFLARGMPSLALIKATTSPCRGLIAEQSIDELERVFNRKFPKRLPLLHEFLSETLPTLELVPIPAIENEAEAQIRDASDRPILRAALAANADVLLTGDKDFLEAGLTGLEVLTPAQFMRDNVSQEPSARGCASRVDQRLSL